MASRYCCSRSLLAPARSRRAGTAADIARAIRENSFDRDECYRVRDLTLVKEDIRLYFTDGHLIFSKPVAGTAHRRRVRRRCGRRRRRSDPAPARPRRARCPRALHPFAQPRRALPRRASCSSPATSTKQLQRAAARTIPRTRRRPKSARVLDEEWTPALRNLGASYQTRLTLELIGGPARRGELFAAMINSPKLGNFDVVFDPDASDQIFAGQLPRATTGCISTPGPASSRSRSRKNPPPKRRHADAARLPDRCHGRRRTCRCSAITRVKVKPDGGRHEGRHLRYLARRWRSAA